MSRIEELEKLRKKAIMSQLFILILIISAFLFIFFLSSNIIFFILAFVLIFTYSFYANKTIVSYKNKFKEHFVESALSRVINNLEYNHEFGFSKENIKDTGLLSTGDIFSSNDYVKGTYKNVTLEFADIHVQEQRGSGKNKHYVTTFLGSYMVFEFNKKFKSNVRLWEKGFYAVDTNGLFRENKYKNVEMEDIDFNNNFTTQAHNQLDAFLILTPHMMEKLKKLTYDTRGEMLFGFIDNKLYIANNTSNDSFEPSVWKKIDEEKVVEVINSQISEITKFVEDLNLDNALFR